MHFKSRPEQFMMDINTEIVQTIADRCRGTSVEKKLMVSIGNIGYSAFMALEFLHRFDCSSNRIAKRS